MSHRMDHGHLDDSEREWLRASRRSAARKSWLLIGVLVVAAIVFVERGQRRITVQYAKRVVGRRQYGGSSTHIPLKVNTGGVIPVIFASSILVIPQTIAQMPCYCHCDRGMGHKSLYSCFEDDHAAHCAVCVNEALLALKLEKEQKLTPAQIRETIVAQYSH